MTYLDVVTGFLGAGKTTFLSRYVRWLEKQNIRYCVIENEFGRAGVVGALLQKQGVRVKEISGGCVCCTLKVTLHDLIRELSGQADRIILEPSGLFCGDDLMDILSGPGCTVQPGMWLGIVDPLSVAFMNGEDRAVLRSEIMQAGSIVLSKAQLCSSDELSAASAMLAGLLVQPLPAVWDRPWDSYSDDEWFPALQAAGTVPRPHERRSFDHISMFRSAVCTPHHILSGSGVQTAVHRLMQTDGVLRAKGTLPAPGGLWLVNASPGCQSISFEPGEAAAALNVIGRNFDRKHIRSILEESDEH